MSPYPDAKEIAGVVPPEDDTGLVPVTDVTWAVFETFPRPTSDAVTVSQAGAADTVPVPVWLRNFFVVVVFPKSLLRVLEAEQ